MTLPPARWLAVMWRCMSAKPPTVPSGLVPLNGEPVALTSASGNCAQPVSRTRVKTVSGPSLALWTSDPDGEVVTRRPVEVDLIANELPEIRGRVHSVAGP